MGECAIRLLSYYNVNICFYCNKTRAGSDQSVKNLPTAHATEAQETEV